MNKFQKFIKEHKVELLVWAFAILWAIFPDPILGPLDDFLVIIIVWKFYKKIAEFLITLKENWIGGLIGIVGVFLIVNSLLQWNVWIAILLGLIGYIPGAYIISKLRGKK